MRLEERRIARVPAAKADDTVITAPGVDARMGQRIAALPRQ